MIFQQRLGGGCVASGSMIAHSSSLSSCRRIKPLQVAVTNAAGLLIQRAGSKAAAVTIDVGSPMLKDAIRYVERGAPAALARKGVTPEHVAKAIIAKIPQIESPSVDTTRLP